jgi:putative membrane-bound dehydrogenase-like protein
MLNIRSTVRHWTLSLALIAAAGIYSSQVRGDEKPRPKPVAPKLTTDAKASEAMVGVATVDVTPDYPVRLNGFGGRRTESDGVTQRIFVKALTIGDDAKSAAVLVTMDNLGIPDWMTREVGQRLHEKTGLDPERLTITFTHTHTAPMLRGTCATIFSAPIPSEHQERIDKYTEQMTTALVEVVTKALDSRQKSQLSWGVGAVRFAVNRRTGGRPVDHDLPVLVVRDSGDKVRAIYTSYACHCVTFGHNQISGDWAGFAAAALEESFPGATAMVSIGCGADSNPDSGVTNGDIKAATRQGNLIRDEVKRLVAGTLQPIKGQVDVHTKRIALPLAELPPREFWEKRVSDPSGHVSLHAKAQLARLDRGEKLRTEVSYPIRTWTFGDDLAMVFLAGEVVVDYATRLKSELVADRVWTTGYANDFSFYIPSERVLREGGYEGGDAFIYFDMPGKFAPGLEQKIIDEVHRQVPDTFNATHDPKRTGGTSPRSPARSLEAMRVRPGMKVELMAAEPLVIDPVAIDFGPDGKLWVAEMHDYPLGIDGNLKPGGRVKLVTDTNGDGRYDAASTFLDNLPFPTDVKIWRSGVLVCAAPDILYAEDTDADGRADVVKKLFTGFATHNYQARVNSLQYGLDNWVYASSGLFGGKITSFTGKSIDLTSRDFRIKPDTGEIEPVTGQSQQGRVRDDWDNWFGCDSGQFIRHYPVVDRYVRRNRDVSPPGTAINVASFPESNRVYPVSPLVTFKLSGPAGYATAACGIGIYRDDFLGAGFYGNSFTCEPVCQVVHRLVLSPQGTTFAGRRAADEQQSEFLASSDNWFRPVQTKTGPDGALWVVDMYRYVIEHPIWIPPDVVATLDVRAGDQMGRLYRVVPADRTPRPMLALDKFDVAALVAALDTANGPTRDLVHQMLIWRGDRSATPLLGKLATSSARPQVRAQARCVLDGLGLLSKEIVASGLRDANAGVRRHSLRLIESLAKDQARELATLAIQLADDPDPQVRLQLAYTLGELDGAATGSTIAKLVTRDGADAYLRAAALSSLRPGDSRGFISTVLGDPRSTTELLADLAANGPCVGKFDDWSFFLNAALERGAAVGDENDRADRWTILAKLLESYERRFASTGQVFEPNVEKRLATELHRASEVAFDDDAATTDRIRAVRLLGIVGAKREDQWQRIAALLHPRHAAAIQEAALSQLARFDDAAIPDLLLAERESQTPAVRNAVVDALLAREAWTKRLLDEIEQQRIGASELDVPRRERLLQIGSEPQRQRVAKLFAASSIGTRSEIVALYASAATASGDRDRGRVVFEKSCAACHRLDGIGHEVGPDLAPLATKPPQALLLAILDPNQAVDPRYVSYAARTEDGQLITGILTSESDASVTLASQDGKQHVLLRRDIDELRSTGKSLMPEGLERDTSPAQLADLLAYLASAASPVKSFAGVVPRTVKAGMDGAVVLRASECEIRGPSVVFEAEFGNLGYWHSDLDSASWTVEMTTAGKFDVELDYACADDSQGNWYTLTRTGGSNASTNSDAASEQTVKGKVVGTRTWSRYRTARVGTLSLAAGAQRIVMRGETPLNRALFDLRSIRLVPASSRSAMKRKDGADDTERTPAVLAKIILDDKAAGGDRERAVADAAKQAAAVIAELALGLRADDAKPTAESHAEEYRRIPWIWRISIDAGRRNDAAEIKEILAASLPQPNAPLRDWQSVVIGGGVINGISQKNVWPKERIEHVLKGDAELRDRWRRAIEHSSAMTDDAKVPHGTRYDALRMLGVDTWDRRGKQIVSYLGKDVNAELQMGAVSALGDMQAREAAAALLDGLGDLTEGNRKLALDALLRNDERCALLLERVETKRLARDLLGERRVGLLKAHANEKIRLKAAELFP